MKNEEDDKIWAKYIFKTVSKTYPKSSLSVKLKWIVWERRHFTEKEIAFEGGDVRLNSDGTQYY